MRGRRLLVYVTATLAVGACSERQPNTPTSPDFASGAPTTKPACSYAQLKKDVDAEWPNSADAATKDTNTAVSALLATMQQSPADSNLVTETGFRIIQSVAIAASTKQAGTSAAAGSTLVTDLFPCMDVPASSVPATVEPSLQLAGAFGVRARTWPAGFVDAEPLYTHDRAWNVKPVNGLAWSAVATRNPASTVLNDQVKHIFLIWGQPGATGNFTDDVLLATSPSPVFEWNATPLQLFQTTAPAGPGVQITQCDDFGFLQHNAKPAAKILASFAATCDNLSGPTAYLRHSPRSVLQKLRAFFTPEPAYAGTGGTSSKTGSFSHWGVINPGKLQLTQISTPNKQTNQVGVPLKDTQGNLLSVTPATFAGSPFGPSGAFVWLEALNNQGVNVLVCNNWAYTDASGKATFTHAYLNKAGGYTLTYKTLAEGATGKSTDVTPFTTALFNVKNGTLPLDGGCTGSNVFIYDPASTTLPAPPGPPPVP
jgi:hypothetical protein